MEYDFSKTKQEEQISNNEGLGCFRWFIISTVLGIAFIAFISLMVTL